MHGLRGPARILRLPQEVTGSRRSRAGFRAAANDVRGARGRCAGNSVCRFTCGSTEMRASFETILGTVLPRLRLGWKHLELHSGDAPPQERIDVLNVIPPTKTWSRARHRPETRHTALRSRSWPWRLPEIVGEDRALLERENEDLRFGLAVAHNAFKRNPSMTFALAAPEDRGALDGVHPGSVWQIKELRRWSRRHELRRTAVNQCELGLAGSAAPLGILLHARANGSSARNTPLRAGWPRHSPLPGGHYIRPLPRHSRCGTNHVVPEADRGNTSRFTFPATPRFIAALTLRPHVRNRARMLGHLPGLGDFFAQHLHASSTADAPRENRLLETDSESDQTWLEPSSEIELEPEERSDLEKTSSS